MNTHVKKAMLATVVAATWIGAVQAASVRIDGVQQRYPWNGKVDIDYTITLADGEKPLALPDDAVQISFVNDSVTPPTTNVAVRFNVGMPPISAGSHRVTWDANADGVKAVADRAKILVDIIRYGEAYMVVDLRGGPTATSYPVFYLNAQPDGTFNQDAYKGDYMVFRRIHAGSFVMGSPETELQRTGSRETQHGVRLTKSFYIGIFEVTQKQYENIMGEEANVSNSKGPYRPAENVSWGTIRGTIKGSKWPVTTDIDDNSLLKKLRDRTGLDTFDLPTEAQWEYACRAGSDTPFNDGIAVTAVGDLTTRMNTLGRYNGNTGDERGSADYVTHTKVGCYQPNNWELYDMHGNVHEWCLDIYDGSHEDPAAFDDPVDPVGYPTGSFRVCRGGAYNSPAQSCRVAYRVPYMPPGSGNVAIGFRLVRVLP